MPAGVLPHAVTQPSKVDMDALRSKDQELFLDSFAGQQISTHTHTHIYRGRSRHIYMRSVDALYNIYI